MRTILGISKLSKKSVEKVFTFSQAKNEAKADAGHSSVIISTILMVGCTDACRLQMVS